MTYKFVQSVAIGVGVALLGASQAYALPQFTFSPSAVAGVTAANFTADNLLLSDYSRVVLTPSGSGATFTDVGTLAVTGAQLGGTTFGIPSNLGLYFSFSGTGVQNTPTFNSATQGTFTSLNYTLYGFQVTGTVNYSATSAPTGGIANLTALATGTLIDGSVGSNTIQGVSVPNASTLLTLTPTVQGRPFFVSPVPFYNADFAAFTNTPSQVTFDGTGFQITQGGGSANFLVVPEPASLAVLGVGLLGAGFTRMRRRNAAA